MFAAAMTSNDTVRDAIIERLASRAAIATKSGAFPLNYEGVNGTTTSGIAR